MPDLRFSTTALASLESFDDFLRQRNSQTANQLLTEIEGLCALICEFPDMGRAIKGTRLRFLISRKYRYRVVYRQTAGQIEIVDVLHPKSGK